MNNKRRQLSQYFESFLKKILSGSPFFDEELFSIQYFEIYRMFVSNGICQKSKLSF